MVTQDQGGVQGSPSEDTTSPFHWNQYPILIGIANVAIEDRARFWSQGTLGEIFDCATMKPVLTRLEEEDESEELTAWKTLMELLWMYMNEHLDMLMTTDEKHAFVEDSKGLTVLIGHPAMGNQGAHRLRNFCTTLTNFVINVQSYPADILARRPITNSLRTPIRGTNRLDGGHPYNSPFWDQPTVSRLTMNAPGDRTQPFDPLAAPTPMNSPQDHVVLETVSSLGLDNEPPAQINTQGSGNQGVEVHGPVTSNQGVHRQGAVDVNQGIHGKGVVGLNQGIRGQGTVGGNQAIHWQGAMGLGQGFNQAIHGQGVMGFGLNGPNQGACGQGATSPAQVLCGQGAVGARVATDGQGATGARQDMNGQSSVGGDQGVGTNQGAANQDRGGTNSGPNLAARWHQYGVRVRSAVDTVRDQVARTPVFQPHRLASGGGRGQHARRMPFQVAPCTPMPRVYSNVNNLDKSLSDPHERDDLSEGDRYVPPPVGLRTAQERPKSFTFRIESRTPADPHDTYGSQVFLPEGKTYTLRLHWDQEKSLKTLVPTFTVSTTGLEWYEALTTRLMAIGIYIPPYATLVPRKKMGTHWAILCEAHPEYVDHEEAWSSTIAQLLQKADLDKSFSNQGAGGGKISEILTMHGDDGYGAL
jgi:hypothetical protein